MTNSQTNASFEAGFDAGIAAERNRIVGILQSDEGKARPAAALDLATTPGGITSETARKLLSRMPVEGAPVAGGPSFSRGEGDSPSGKSGLITEAERLAAEEYADAGLTPPAAVTPDPRPHMRRLMGMIDTHVATVTVEARTGASAGALASLSSQPERSGLSAAMDDIAAEEIRRAGR